MEDPSLQLIFLSADHRILIEMHEAREFPYNLAVPDDAVIGHIEYIPQPGSRTNRMYAAFSGMQQFIEEVDGLSVVKPDYLFAQTNGRMAKLAKRLGFELTDLTPNTADVHRKFYEVLGDVNTVRTELLKLSQRTDRSGKSLPNAIKQRIR